MKFTSHHFVNSAFTIAAVAIAALAGVSSAQGADAAAATNAPPKPHWESVASADLTMTRGNSHTFLGAISINSARKSPNNEFLLGGSAGYGDTTTKQSDGSEEKTET